MGRLQSDAAAIGSRDPDRAALVAADGHIDLAAGDQRRRARRGTAGRVTGLVRVLDRAGSAGMAAAGQAKILAMGLADDGRAGVEQTGNDGRVHVGRIALERGCAVHHRHLGEADIVLESDRPTRQGSFGRAANFRPHMPGVVWVVVGRGTAEPAPGIFHRRQIVRHRIDDVVGVQRTLHHVEEVLDPVVRHVHAQLLDNFLELGVCRSRCCHVRNPSVEDGTAAAAERRAAGSPAKLSGRVFGVKANRRPPLRRPPGLAQKPPMH